MKKISLILSILFCSVFACMSKTMDYKQRTIRDKGNLYVEENGHIFLVDSKLIVVKPKRGVELGRDYKIASTSLFGFYDLYVPEGMDIEEFSESLKNTNLFETVEYITECEFCLVPNDPLLVRQWHIDKLHLKDVWDTTTGSSNVKLAIIDTGVNRDHEDLGYSSYGNFTNISYTLGWDYINNCQYATPSNSHGTYVALIAGAKTNNAFSGAGVVGGNNGGSARLISYRVSNSLHLRDAINKAVNDGVNVINISFKIASYSYIDSAIVNAYNHNVTLVCASGNDSLSTICYPASHPLTIAVGATDQSDARCSFSNYGSGLDLVAPGEGIAIEGTSQSWASTSGTSLSAPMVSGTIALMLSVNSNLSPSEIRNILHSSAKKSASYFNTGSAWNSEVGYGLLNPRAAVSLASTLEITGPDQITDSVGVYEINNLSSDFDVVWSLTDSYYNQNCLEQNAPSANKCTIRRSNVYSMTNGILYASIYYDGLLIKSLTKSGISASALIFPGTYYNGQEIKTINLPSPLYVLPGTQVVITSSKLVGATVSQTGGNGSPTYWYFNNSNGILMVGVPSSSGTTIVVHVVCPDGSTYNLPIITISSTSQLSLTYEEDCIEVSLVGLFNNSDIEGGIVGVTEISDWTLEVRNALTGEKSYGLSVNGSSCSVDTSVLKPGLYIVRAITDRETLSQKFVVK